MGFGGGGNFLRKPASITDDQLVAFDGTSGDTKISGIDKDDVATGSVPVKATSAELLAGSNDAKFATALGLFGAVFRPVWGWLTNPFGGSGADGPGPATTGNLDASTLKQYSSWTINAGQTITLTSATGVSRICVSGDLVINGTLTAKGKGGAGVNSNGGHGGVYFSAFPGTGSVVNYPMIGQSAYGGTGGSGARSGGSGTSTAGGNFRVGLENTQITNYSGGAARSSDQAGANGTAWRTLAQAGFDNTYRPGAGFVGAPEFLQLGVGGCSGGNGVHGGATDGVYGAGGNGGGVIIIEVAGSITIGASGSVLASGDNGTNGGNGTNAGGGGGGGGGGGRIAMRCGGTYTNSGTVSVAGGTGGTGGTGASFAGGNGADGLPGQAFIDEV